MRTLGSVLILIILIQGYSEAEGIPIFTVEQLQKIGRDPDYPINGSYYLANDIDATETQYWNNREGFRPIGRRDKQLFEGITGWVRKQFQFYCQEFEGTFDGKGHKISGLHIVPKKEEAEFIGLFALIGEKGCVRNLIIENVYIEDNDPLGISLLGTVAGENKGIIENVHTSGNLYGLSYIGGIVGGNYNEIKECSSSCNIKGEWAIGGISGKNTSSISHCSFSGTITPNHIISRAYEGIYMGGIIGSNYLEVGKISYCYSTGSIEGKEYIGGLVGVNSGEVFNCYATGSVKGVEFVGGFVGKNLGKINNCYSKGNVQGDNSVGGFVGQNVFDDRYQQWIGIIPYGTIINCYSTGKVEGKKDFGGFVGLNKPACTILSCFWDKETSTLDLSAGGVGKTTIEMMQQKTYEDEVWCFESIWKIDENNSYPYLIWEKENSKKQ